MDRDVLVKKVEEMLAYRGFTNVKKDVGSDMVHVLATGYPVGHAKENASVLFAIDSEVKYSSAKVNKIFASLTKRVAVAKEKYKVKFGKGSSVGYVYAYKPAPASLNTILENAAKMEVYTEVFHYSEFIIDHRDAQFAKNWRIVSAEESALLPGKPTLRPPRILITDPMVKYTGAQVGEYLLFDRIEMGEAGAKTCIELRIVERNNQSGEAGGEGEDDEIVEVEDA